MTSPEDVSKDSKVQADTIYSCEFCSKAFSTKRSVRLHKQNKHPNNASAGDIACSFCSGLFNSKHMYKHIRKKHPEEALKLPETESKPWRLEVTEPAPTEQIVMKKRSECIYCPKAFGGKDFLERHMQLKHPDQRLNEKNKTNEAGEFPNPEDNVPTAANMNSKLLIMLLPDQLPTDENSTEEANVVPKQEYIATEYPTDEVEENAADMLTKNEDNVIEDPSDNASTWQCGTCEKYLTNKTSLKRHMIRHLEVKPFKCQFCGKQFTRNGLLTTHVKKHHTIDISSMEPEFNNSIVSLCDTSSEPEPGTLQE